MNKKAVSEVVVGLFLILLAFVSVAIVSLVISNIIQTESEKVSLEGFFVDLDLQSVKVQDDGSVSVSVKRNPGDGILSGIKFVFSDGQNSKVIEKEADLKELEQNTYTFSQEELEGLNAKDVSIAPVVNGFFGETETKNIIETEIVPEISTTSENEIIVINFATISEGDSNLSEIIE
ncbi:hypothetical protein HYT25_00160 [Candidatus Pacearchaeota archaeon]|nr:hypothetical protein [Candidatus Pacearchaeota archaeon]